MEFTVTHQGQHRRRGVHSDTPGATPTSWSSQRHTKCNIDFVEFAVTHQGQHRRREAHSDTPSATPTSWSSQYFVQTLTRMADSSRAKVKEASNVSDQTLSKTRVIRQSLLGSLWVCPNFTRRARSDFVAGRVWS